MHRPCSVREQGRFFCFKALDNSLKQRHIRCFCKSCLKGVALSCIFTKENLKSATVVTCHIFCCS